MVLNRIGALACGLILFYWKIVNIDLDRGEDDPHKVPDLMPVVEQRLLVLAAISVFLLLEFDRINGQARLLEAEQLSVGFQGSIAHATCSEEADATRIFREIGEKTAAVDYAIHVLLAAGMSSPTLTDIARRGVNVSEAGSAEIAWPFLALVPLCLLSLWTIFVQFVYLQNHAHLWSIPLWLLECMSVLARAALLCILWWSPRDARCFILKMMSRLVALYMIISCPLMAIWQRQSQGPDRGWLILPLVVYTTVLGIACISVSTAAVADNICLCSGNRNSNKRWLPRPFLPQALV